MIVRTEQDVAALLEFINANDELFYDVESTGVNVRKDTVMGFGISNCYSGFYVPLYVYNPTTDSILPYGVGPELVRIILNTLLRKKLSMYYANFDAPITKNSLGIDLLPALHEDVLLLKHTCDENYPFKLKEVGAMLFGVDVKKEQKEMLESIKRNGGKPTEYYKAELECLAKYCIQDCLLTARVRNHYKKQLIKDELEQFFYVDEVMPLLREVTVPMEQTGVALDIPKLEQAQQDITLALKKLENQIQAEIAPLLSTVFEPWFLNKDYPLQTYKGNMTLLGRRFADSDNGQYKGAPLVFQKEAWAKDNEGYMFGLHNKHHLKKLFFDTLHEEAISRTAPSKTYPQGQPQVDEGFLEAMSAKHSWAKLLIEFNKLSKIKSTYIDRFLNENEGGIFYPSFGQHQTVSGRYGSDIQQMPRTQE